jgi:hypothetical protein
VTEDCFRFRDNSAPKDDPIHNAPTGDALRDALADRIGASDVVLVASLTVNYSEWIEQEVALCRSARKPIVGLIPHRAERASSIVQESADRMVDWQRDEIVTAIRELDP